MERALELITTETLTIKVARNNAHRGKTLALPSHFNYHTGKKSKLKTGFNDSTWGDTTCDFTEAASNLSNKKFTAIVKEAELYTSIKNRARKSRTKATEVVEIGGKCEQACLVSEDEDGDKQCKFILSLCNLTNMIGLFRILSYY